MRFIGNKENLLETIHGVMCDHGMTGTSFFDVFAGTASVAKYFKKLGYETYCSDLLYFSYVLQEAYIGNNRVPTFINLEDVIPTYSDKLFTTPLDRVITFLNELKPVHGFIYKNYTPAGTADLEQPRMYFTPENGAKIDAIRQQIEDWHVAKAITDDEYYVLLAALIETVPFYSNITGVYGAFQKKWDIRATKTLQLRPIALISNGKSNRAFNKDSAELAKEISADIFYLDPPYNQRQYAPNYHVLETIARYDNPKIKGVTGMRDYAEQKSNFCNTKKAIEELDTIAAAAQCNNLVLSYNSEGIMPSKEIIAILKKYGEVELVEFQHYRFKSNNNGTAKDKKLINEQLYLLKKHE